MLIGTSPASVMLQMAVRLLLTHEPTPDWFSLSLLAFFTQSLSCRNVGCYFSQVLHGCLSLQFLAMCWSLKQLKHSFFSSINSRRLVRVFFKNCSQLFKLWGLLHKQHNKDCLLQTFCFNPVAKLVPFPLLCDILLNSTQVPLSFSSWWRLVTFSSEITGSVASLACSWTNCENSSKSAILPFALLVLLFLSIHLLRRCLGNFSQSCLSTWAVFKIVHVRHAFHSRLCSDWLPWRQFGDVGICNFKWISELSL